MSPRPTPLTESQKRKAAREKFRQDRDADIRASLKAGVPKAVLSRKYLITMERVRQIGAEAPRLAPSLVNGDFADACKEIPDPRTCE